MPFLAPIFIAGLGLIAIPWFLHHVRKPEHKPVHFSSLIFIPQMKREVVKHRKIQHLLLMLLRMLLLVLLAFAFARPYSEKPPAIVASEDIEQHIILIDSSYSMGTLDGFNEAKSKALDILDDIGSDARVGIVGFSRVPSVAAPLGSSAKELQEAIGSLELTEESTDYGASLRFAEEMLTYTAEDGSQDLVRGAVYLISDFQRVGMPKSRSSWRLPPAVKFFPVEIGEGGASNQSITDLSIEEVRDGSIRIQAKVKNWSLTEEASVQVELSVNEEQVNAQSLVVGSGNSRQVSFTLDSGDEDEFAGLLQVTDETLAADNFRGFTWSTKKKDNVILLTDSKNTGAKRWPASTLLAHVLPNTFDSPWLVSVMDQEEWANRVEAGKGQPEILVVCDLNEDLSDISDSLLDYVRAGGQVLLPLNEIGDLAVLNESLLLALGLRTTGLRYPKSSETRFDLLASVDLDHPVFLAFRGARFNDFSHIRFFNYYRMEIDSSRAGEAEKVEPQVIAGFEGDGGGSGSPAIMEVGLGKGRVMVWVFAVDLDWTTLPKTSRFLPLVHETLHYMSNEDEKVRSWIVGDYPVGPGAVASNEGMWKVTLPGGELLDLASGESLLRPLTRTGMVQWKHDDFETRWHPEAVNVDSREGDPARISPLELELALCSAPVLDRHVSDGQEISFASAGSVPQRAEYGLFALGVFFLLLIVESWFASRLTASHAGSDIGTNRE
jgi:hypothetical protein